AEIKPRIFPKPQNRLYAALYSVSQKTHVLLPHHLPWPPTFFLRLPTLASFLHIRLWPPQAPLSSPPHVIPHPFFRETALGRRKMPHQSFSLSRSIFERFFLLLHDVFVSSSKIGVSKNSNSKFEFLEPKSTIKGGLRFSTKIIHQRPKTIQEQAR
ncbi:hypothetical protein AABB24_021467, partial [Solanum stoloniferum]